jgi:hypothetical protein
MRKINLSAMSAKYVGESHVAQTQQIVILGFNHDTLTSSVNGKTKALLTVQPLRVLSNGTTREPGYMRGSAKTDTAWDTTDRRSWCNDTFKSALPDYIRTLVKQVKKDYCTNSNTLATATTNDYIWLLSENEVFNVKKYAATQEGTQYEYYKTEANREKYIGDVNNKGLTSAWTERSIERNINISQVTYGVVTTSGTPGSGGETGNYGICPAWSM